MERNVKQVIVIRKDLGMRRGKEIAQGAHASIAWLTRRVMTGAQPALAGRIQVHAVVLSAAEREWTEGNFRKICCVVNSEDELLLIAKKAREAGVICEVIEDSGLTEFGGVPTITALAVGPDTDEKIDPITGDLKLY